AIAEVAFARIEREAAADRRRWRSRRNAGLRIHDAVAQLLAADGTTRADLAQVHRREVIRAGQGFSGGAIEIDVLDRASRDLAVAVPVERRVLARVAVHEHVARIARADERAIATTGGRRSAERRIDEARGFGRVPATEVGRRGSDADGFGESAF